MQPISEIVRGFLDVAAVHREKQPSEKQRNEDIVGHELLNDILKCFKEFESNNQTCDDVEFEISIYKNIYFNITIANKTSIFIPSINLKLCETIKALDIVFDIFDTLLKFSYSCEKVYDSRDEMIKLKGVMYGELHKQ